MTADSDSLFAALINEDEMPVRVLDKARWALPELVEPRRRGRGLFAGADGSALAWRMPATPRLVGTSTGLLVEFVRIADMDESRAIAARASFAKRWGPLRLRLDGLPEAHGIRVQTFVPLAGWLSSEAAEGEERLDHWRLYSRLVAGVVAVRAAHVARAPTPRAALLRLFFALEALVQIELAYWVEKIARLDGITDDESRAAGDLPRLRSALLIREELPDGWAAPSESSTSQEATYVHTATEALLRWSGVRPVIEKSGSEHDIGWSGCALGAIAMELAALVVDRDWAPVCSGCSRPYARAGRAVKRGQRNFCDSCKEAGVPLRLAQRDRRGRLREKEGTRPKRSKKKGHR